MPNNNMDDIEILCRHLSKQLDIEIVFEDDVTPCTNGKKIKLPNNLNKDILFELLAVLLHETAHIRYTDFTVFNNNSEIMGNKLLCEVINVLEDIRIDTAVLDKYPQACELYYMLYKYANKENNKKEEESIPWRVLKHMILKARLGEGFASLYYDQTALEIIEKLKLDEEINASKLAINTNQLVAHAKSVIRKLADYIARQKQSPQPELSAEQLGQSSSGTNTSKNQKKLDEVNKKLTQSTEESNQKYQEYVDARDKYALAQKTVRNAEKLIHRKERDIMYNLCETAEKLDKTKKQKERAKEKLEKEKRPQLLESGKEYEKAREETNKASKERDTNGREQWKLEQLQDKLRNEYSDETLMGVSDDSDSFGFGAIKKEDIIKAPTEYSKLTLTKSLDQRLREFFVEKKEERQQDEDGTRLNRNRLSNLFTTGSNLFTLQNEVMDPTNIIFLLDNSGSMSSHNRSSILVSAMTTLLKSLGRVINEENLPVQTAIYTFDDRVEAIKQFDDELDPDVVAKSYQTLGGTKLLNSVNEMARVFQERGDNARKLLIVITDAEVQYEEIKALHNQANSEMRTVYIGMNVYFKCNEAKELFNEGNIKSEDEILRVLERVISQ